MKDQLIRSILFFMGAFLAFPTNASFSHDGIKLGTHIKSLPVDVYTCPRGSFATEIQCVRNSPGQAFGITAKKVILTFHKNRCSLIYIGLSPSDLPVVGKAVHKKFGEPSALLEIMKGVYVASWNREKSILSLVRDVNWGNAWISITSSESKPSMYSVPPLGREKRTP